MGRQGAVLWAVIRWLLEVKKERKNNERERKKVGVYIKERDIYNMPLECLSSNETCVSTGANPRLAKMKPDAEIKAASRGKNARLRLTEKTKVIMT